MVNCKVPFDRNNLSFSQFSRQIFALLVPNQPCTSYPENECLRPVNGWPRDWSMKSIVAAREEGEKLYPYGAQNLLHSFWCLWTGSGCPRNRRRWTDDTYPLWRRHVATTHFCHRRLSTDWRQNKSRVVKMAWKFCQGTLELKCIHIVYTHRASFYYFTRVNKDWLIWWTLPTATCTYSRPGY